MNFSPKALFLKSFSVRTLFFDYFKNKILLSFFLILVFSTIGINKGFTQAGCVVGTGNRIAGTWHSDLYIAGNTSSGSNDLYGWGQNMPTLVGLTPSVSGGTDVFTPTLISSSTYSGTALEVRGSSPSSSTNVFGLRTSTDLYIFGDAISTLTNWSGFGGTSLSTGKVTNKLPSGVVIADIAEFRISAAAIALLTNSGEVYMLSKNKNLRGDSTATEGTVWHKVKLADGTTALSDVTKISVSGSGVMALTTTGGLFYWGDGNPYGNPTAPKSYSYAHDISSAIPSGTNISDVLVAGASHSNLFLLTTDGDVYSSGYNDKGILGTNTTTGVYTSTFSKVKKESDGTGASTLTNITKIDGGNNGDLNIVVAMNASGQIFGWGDNNQYGMLGTSKATSGTNTDVFGAKPIFTSTTALYSVVAGGTASTTAAPGTGYSDVSIGGHFIIAFYTSGGTSQYWYQGHNTNGSIGYNPDAVLQSGTIFGAKANIDDIYAPTYLDAPAGTSFACSNTQPTIITSGGFSSFNACLNLASATQTITISGINLSDNISVTAPSGFEVSTSSGSGFGSTATLTKSGSNVASTTLYVRVTALATGTVSGTLSLTSTGATSKTFTITGTVNTLPVVTSVTGASRTGTGTLIISANTVTASSTIDWYQNSTGGTALATGTNSTTSFTTPSLSTTTNYFAQARSLSTGCVSSTRSVTLATILGSFTAGSIGTDQSICYNQAPNSLTSVSDASGGSGTISYQWQISTTSISTGFSNISGETLTTITLTGSLTQTTYYRRAASTTANGTIYTDAITITVNALPTASAAVNNSRTGSGPVIISASASTGATLDWYANATNGSILTGGNGVKTFTTPSISETTTYFAEARNTTTGCIAASRISVVATIIGSFSPGSIAADQTMCSGSTPAALSSITSASGGSGTITYQWQLSTTSSSSGFTNISGETSTTYTPTGSFTQTTYFKRAATTTADGTKYTNVITITVNNLPSAPTAVDGSRTGSGIVNISVTAGAGETANWYAASTGGSILSGGNGTLNYSTPSISATTSYYAEAKNSTTGCISSSRTAVVATINASTSSPTISLSGSLTNLTTCSGIVSSVQTFGVSGTDLADDIIINAPTGYELSLNNTSGFGPNITLVQSGGTVSSTVYLRLSSAAVNAASGNISANSTGATSQIVSTGTATVNILPAIPTGVNGSRTGTGSVDIAVTVGAGETANWYAASSGGTILSGGTSTLSYSTPSISTTTTYYAEARNTSTSCVSSNRIGVIATINNSTPPPTVLPQGSISLVDKALLNTDTAQFKFDFTSGTPPFLVVLSNSTNSIIDTLKNAITNKIFRLNKYQKNTIFKIEKITDSLNESRINGFSKDTVKLTILEPLILLTLKAEPAVKQVDNSFKTKLLLKVKNAGSTDLNNVQVNANLTSVFPDSIKYKLDSIRVAKGNLKINPNYKGDGVAKAILSVVPDMNKGISKNISNNTIDANYLFDNGVNLSVGEEGDVDYFITILPNTSNITLKLQFTSAATTQVTKSDGSISNKSTYSISDDGTAIDQHPNTTLVGTPAPTYIPLVPVESIGASLALISSSKVTEGYLFHFIAKIKNYGNTNMDSIVLRNNFKNSFTTPDSAYIYKTPVVTGNLVLNSSFDGYYDDTIVKYGAKLSVSDSATIEYDLLVKSSKDKSTWLNNFIAYGSITSSNHYINDTSTNGLSPDPNNDGNSIEKELTRFSINYTRPLPPTTINGLFTLNKSTIPNNVSSFVKTVPIGAIPVWINPITAASSATPPILTEVVGRYIYILKSYDTSSLLYSDAIVFDTITIKPPVPIVADSSFIFGVTKNPLNINDLVTGLNGSKFNYFINNIKQTTVPVLPSSIGLNHFTVSQILNSVESDTVSLNVTILDPNNLLHLQKIVDAALIQANSAYNFTFKIIASNLSQQPLNNIVITDNLLNSVMSPITYSILSIKSTGGLVANKSYNGSTDINLSTIASKLAVNAKDTISFVMNLLPKGYAGNLYNVADIKVNSIWGDFAMRSSSMTKAQELAKLPTMYTVPELPISIPEGFSPNNDGVNDRFVIIKPYGTIIDLEIFNRWGNVVYSNSNYNNEWDGKGVNNFMGQDLVDGGYYYSIKAIDIKGVASIFKGFIIIQR